MPRGLNFPVSVPSSLDVLYCILLHSDDNTASGLVRTFIYPPKLPEVFVNSLFALFYEVYISNRFQAHVFSPVLILSEQNIICAKDEHFLAFCS